MCGDKKYTVEVFANLSVLRSRDSKNISLGTTSVHHPVTDFIQIRCVNIF